MYLSKANHRSGIRDLKQVQVSEDGSLKLAIVSDTHSAPYAGATELIAGLHPNAILHAGDIGDLHILDQFAAICPVYAVRGNIDQRLPTLPDVLVLKSCQKKSFSPDFNVTRRSLWAQTAIAGYPQSKIRRCFTGDMWPLSCSFHRSGHGYTVFNPGSMGPRRNGLPIVFGILELNAGNFRLSHVDCETGLP